MRKRCLLITEKSYKHYGGRGISVCAQWVSSFRNFLADMGERPEGTTLGRIDNEGHYEPGNCRWETQEQQAYNKRTTKRYEIDGKSFLTKDIEKVSTVRQKTIDVRAKKGESAEDAITRPRWVRRSDFEPKRTLSKREEIVFKRYAMGWSNGQIADDLRISSKTVSTYRLRVLAKCGFADDREMVQYAWRNGIVA